MPYNATNFIYSELTPFPHASIEVELKGLVRNSQSGYLRPHLKRHIPTILCLALTGTVYI